jgi:hypothetical protein
MTIRPEDIERRIQAKKKDHHMELMKWEFYRRILDDLNPLLDQLPGGVFYHDSIPMWEELDEGGKLLRLDFSYRGDAKFEQDALEDLGDFMLTFKVFLSDLRPKYQFRASTLKGVYDGIGRVGDYRIWLTVTVNWIPESCEVVRKVDRREYFQVTCGKGRE